MKKHISFLLVLLCIAGSSFAGSTPDMEHEGTKLNLWIPGILIKSVAGIADDYTDEFYADLLKHVGNINLCIREGAAYNGSYDKKITRKLNRMERREYAPLLQVYSEATQVQISIKQNKRVTIRRMVVLVDDEGEAFVYVKMNCRFTSEELAELVADTI